MALLTRLSDQESAQLWWMTYQALQNVSEEIGLLERCPAATRDLLYGHGVLESYYGVRDDLADILGGDLGNPAPAT